ncbi:MAG: hypothetical protein ABIO72_04240 [Patescibacteria group bacterium]
MFRKHVLDFILIILGWSTVSLVMYTVRNQPMPVEPPLSAPPLCPQIPSAAVPKGPPVESVASAGSPPMEFPSTISVGKLTIRWTPPMPVEAGRISCAFPNVTLALEANIYQPNTVYEATFSVPKYGDVQVYLGYNGICSPFHRWPGDRNACPIDPPSSYGTIEAWFNGRPLKIIALKESFYIAIAEYI